MYKITKVEKRTNDWKVVSLIMGDEEKTNVSVNRADKNGVLFPDFDKIAVGVDVVGSVWESKGGKWYLSALKENKGGPKSALSEEKLDKILNAQTKMNIQLQLIAEHIMGKAKKEIEYPDAPEEEPPF